MDNFERISQMEILEKLHDSFGSTLMNEEKRNFKMAEDTRSLDIFVAIHL